MPDSMTPVPLNDEQLAAIRARQQHAYDVVCQLCKGERRWAMSIPARPDRDPDLVISASLVDIPKLCDEVARLRAANAALTEVADLARDYREQRRKGAASYVLSSCEHHLDKALAALGDADAVVEAATEWVSLPVSAHGALMEVVGRARRLRELERELQQGGAVAVGAFWRALDHTRAELDAALTALDGGAGEEAGDGGS